MIRGALMMVAASFLFAAMNAVIRLASEELNTLQIVFFRNLFGLAFMLPWVVRSRAGSLRTDRFRLYLVRSLLGVAAMGMWFWALTVLPLAEAVSLSFTTPLFVTVGAALVLREEVKARRWSATVVGFIGALIILRPGIEPLSLPTMVVVVSAMTMAASVLLIKTLSRTETPAAIVFYMGLFMTPLSLPPALAVWQWPSAEVWLLMALLGGFGTAGHLLFTGALRVTDASAVMPFDFIRLPFSALFGYWLFAQTADLWTWIGAGVIFAAGAYITHREVRLGRRRVEVQDAP